METVGKRVFMDDEANVINLQPGEYMLSKNGDVYFKVPSPNYIFLAHVNQTWKITENADKTITITPSILITGADGKPAWHGYLTNGVWREC
jgi:hypothetical protein